MKKFVSLALAAVMSLSAFAALAGCGDDDKKNGENTDPVIEGVKLEDTIFAGEEWDALAGVTASDAEDGDLTDKIEVSAVGLTFTNGKTTPTVADAIGYEVVYTVTDSDGGEAKEYCTLHVNEAVGTTQYVYEADFSDVTPKYDWAEGNKGEGNNHWWSLKKENGAEATATLTEGRLAIDVTNRNSAADYQLMLTRNFADLAVGRYKFAVWAKTPSSGTVKLNMIAELNENSLNDSLKDGDTWEDRNLGGTKEIELTSQYQVFALDFELTQEKLKASADQGEVLFRIGLGVGDNPNAFKVDIEKIIIWKTTGSNADNDLFTLNPAPSTGGLVIDHNWEQAESTLAYDEASQAVKIDITKYNVNDGVWTIVAKAPLTGAALEAGKHYGVEVEMKADTEIKPEIVIGRNGEEDGKDHDPRFIKNDTAVGNTYTKIKGEFDGFATTATHLFFELGKINDTNYPNVTSNVIYIKSIRLFEIEEGVSAEGDELYALDAGAVSGGGTIEITNRGDGAQNVTVGSADGATTVNIGTYNTTGGCWSIIATIPTGVTLDTTKTYGYEIRIKATSAFSNAEMHFGPKTNSDEGDKWYSADIGTIGTEYTTLRHTFKPGAAYSEPSLHLFLGKDPAKNNATTNTVYIESFRFFEVTGNEETSKFQDKFILFGDASPDKTNKKYPISVYNQSDDKWDAAPTGTVYFENNKLVYLIHHGGTDGGHNKLAFGFWDNPIENLPANAYYVVSFKIKASVALDFNVTLHDMERGWEATDGGLLIRCMDFDNKACHAGTTETTIELVSETLSNEAHAKCELLLEFGKFLGTNTDVKIEISDLKIGYRAVQA